MTTAVEDEKKSDQAEVHIGETKEAKREKENEVEQVKVNGQRVKTELEEKEGAAVVWVLAAAVVAAGEKTGGEEKAGEERAKV